MPFAIPSPADRAPATKCLLYLALQLLLMLLVIRQFEIEQTSQLFAVLVIAVAGCPMAALLPVAWRPWLMVLLTSIALVWIVGPVPAAVVLAAGSLLIGICYLPVSAALRILLVAAIVLAAAWRRSESTDLFWPVVGSMFMFRMIVFLGDTRFQRPPLRDAMAYFFMLPNTCFFLFPVVDFTTWQRFATSKISAPVVQAGINWIVHGTLQLLIYRTIRYWILPPPESIDSAGTLLLFLATNYGLYLRVAGTFHIIVGILHLFGFALPRTHDWFFLAGGLTDIWRRINIYWKDFMSKFFFMPAFFMLRRRIDDRLATVLAICWVFLATWLAHSWQVFWLQGEFPLTMLDAGLWLGAGAVVAISSLTEGRSAGEPEDPSVFRLPRATRRTLKTMATFLLVSLFWARWTNPHLLETLDREFGSATFLAANQLLAAAGILCGVFAAGILVRFLLAHKDLQAVFRSLSRGTGRVPLNLAILSMLFLLTQRSLTELLPTETARVVAGLRSDRFTGTEASRLVQGYYEQLSEGSLQAGVFRGGRAGRSTGGRRPHYMDLTRSRDDGLMTELIPGITGEFNGSRITVNKWSMRDRDVDKEKPDGTRRIALLGSSVVMGYGVGDEETFGRLTEQTLNSGTIDEAGDTTWQVLNFGGGKYYAIHRRILLQKRVLDFQPDIVLYFTHQDELIGPLMHLTTLCSRDLVDDDCLRGIMSQANVSSETPIGVIRNRLREFVPQILQCCYDRIVADCRDRGITPVWIYLPMPGKFEIPIPPEALPQMAEQAGFVVLDLSDWADGYEPIQVKLSASDEHANALGHQRIAERLMQELRKHPEILGDPIR